MDRKKLGALIIGLSPGHEEEEEKPPAPPHGEVAGPERSPEELKALHDEAIDDVFDALKADNRQAFRDAFSSAVRVCKMAEEEGLYGDDEEPAEEEGG